MGLLRKIVRTGRVAEPAPDRAVAADPVAAETVVTDSVVTDAVVTESVAAERDRRSASRPSGSVQLRHVDAGSCNGCELEITSAFGPVFDAERYGLRLVASPRHADALLVTGPVTRNMADPLRATYEATPAPKRVVAVGDCALNCGVFAGGHGVEGAVGDVIPVDVEVPGCPPTPEQLIAALRGLTGR